MKGTRGCRVLAVMLLLAFHCVQAGAVETSAAAVVVADGDTGRLLYEYHADEQRLIASTTKLLTAYTAVQLCDDLDRVVTVSAHAAATEGSSMYLATGEEISLRSLLWGMLLVSGNDAAVALAEGCSGSEEAFVVEMNRVAQRIGMMDSHFENPSGLDGETHYATARDLATLACQVRKDPVLSEIVSTQSITCAGRTLTNHNKLLWRYSGCTGMKTGYTEHAGRTLVSSAEREGKALICVTLNDSDDWEDHIKLYDTFFAETTLDTLCTEGEVFGKIRQTGTLDTTLSVCAEETVTCLLCPQETAEERIDWTEDLVSSEIGQVVGTVRWYVCDELVGSSRLIAQAPGAA